MPDPTPLQRVLTDALTFARAHGVTAPLEVDDFAIQRSRAGRTLAIASTASHLVSATVLSDGTTFFGVAELCWLHDETDTDRDLCDCCEVIDPRGFGMPMTTVYLPGDTPTPPTEDTTMQKYLTSTGKTIHTGQHYTDARPTNRRTLHVDRIHEPRDPAAPDERQIDYTVIAVDGQALSRTRANSTTARRLTGREFVLVTGTGTTRA